MKEKLLLKEQSSVKVVLNGGKLTLDDATVPFQIGFDESVTQKKPTHILVIDITGNMYRDLDDGEKERRDDTSNSERTLFELQPINYLQFHKPGRHHLIFILVSKMNKNLRQSALGKTSYRYREDIWLSSIESNDALDYQVAYAEEIVDVPEEFFASKPKTAWQEKMWKWNNKWFSIEPIDQCDYRKRLIVSHTIQPIVWIAGFLLRLVIFLVLHVLNFIIRFIVFLFGYQSVSFFTNLKENFSDYVVSYSDGEFKNMMERFFGDELDLDDKRDAYNAKRPEDVYPYKVLAVGRQRIYTPITIGGLLSYSLFIFAYFSFVFEANWLNEGKEFSVADHLLALVGGVISAFVISFFASISLLPTLKRDPAYRKKFNNQKNIKIFKRIFGILSSVAIISYLIFNVSWMSVFAFLFSFVVLVILTIAFSITLIYIINRNRLWGKIGKFLNILFFPFIWALTKISESLSGTESSVGSGSVGMVKLSPREEWLNKSFRLEALPQKVSIISAPSSSTVVHKFKVGFWALKAKVCKPFPK